MLGEVVADLALLLLGRDLERVQVEAEAGRLLHTLQQAELSKRIVELGNVVRHMGDEPGQVVPLLPQPDLQQRRHRGGHPDLTDPRVLPGHQLRTVGVLGERQRARVRGSHRSEEHTYELQSLMRSSYAVFCLTKKKN